MTEGELKKIEERICSEISLLLSKNAGAFNVDVEMSAYTIECRNPEPPRTNKIIEKLDEIILLLNERVGCA